MDISARKTNQVTDLKRGNKMTKPEKLTVSHRVQIVRPDGESQEQEEELLREYEITIYINGQSKLECSCTPLDLDNFVVGRMFTEGVIEEITDILDYEIYPEEHCVYVTVKEENQKILQKNGQSNCRKRKKELFLWETDWIFRLADTFAEDTVLHRKTSCTHSCFLAQQDQILYVAEDIGRHNAVDKVIGWALREHISLKEMILYTSGRLPEDMLKKAVRARVPLVISNAAPTEEGVHIAKENRISLVGGVRKNQMKIYTDFRK